MKILKVLFNPRVASAIVSAVSAIICATFAGCKLYTGSLALEDFAVEILPGLCSTNQTEIIK